jgi:peptide-methionine (S)-S-oxide reductase
VVSFSKLTDVLFMIHNPTQKNYQGPDHGSQYRSAIFFHSAEQEAAAHASIAAHQPDWKKPIVTEVTAATTFWPAEEYHQRYFEKNGVSHCRIPSGTF